MAETATKAMTSPAATERRDDERERNGQMLFEIVNHGGGGLGLGSESV